MAFGVNVQLNSPWIVKAKRSGSFKMYEYSNKYLNDWIQNNLKFVAYSAL